MNYSIYKRTKLEWLKLIGIWFLISVSLGMLFYKSIVGILIIIPFVIIFEKVNKKKLIEKRKNEEFYEKLTVLELKNKELLADLDKLNAVLGTKEEKPQSDGTVKNQEIDKKQAALEALKAKAKQLENMYEQISEENKK